MQYIVENGTFLCENLTFRLFWAMSGGANFDQILPVILYRAMLVFFGSQKSAQNLANRQMYVFCHIFKIAEIRKIVYHANTPPVMKKGKNRIRHKHKCQVFVILLHYQARAYYNIHNGLRGGEGARGRV